MRILLVMPGVGRKPTEKYVRSWMMEPLFMGVLAALTPEHVQLNFVDDRLEAIPYDAPVDAVGINVETYTARRSYAIAGEFRKRGVKVIFGGYHPTLNPTEAQEFADAIIEGPAERVWADVVADLQAGNLQRRYLGQSVTPQRPNRKIFTNKKYMPIALVETGRGCQFGCEFCSVTQFNQRTIHNRPIAEVVSEMEEIGNRAVFFVDDNIVMDGERLKKLLTALIPVRPKWISQGSITMADDPELLSLMRKSGCGGVLIGFESLSNSTLAAMNKSWTQAKQDYEKSIRKIRDAGIPIYATFVFGYDTDRVDAFQRTVDFAIAQRFTMAAFNHLVPFPGTPLYARLKSEGRLIHDPWWLNPEFKFGDVAFEPKGMSAEQLASKCFAARQDFYRWGSVVRRAWDFKSNCRDVRSTAIYWWANLFSGRQMRARQGLPLGQGFNDEATMPVMPEVLV